MQTSKRKRYERCSSASDDILTLIRLVRQSPALYNYKLNPSQRRRSDILAGWGCISNKLGGRYSVEECRRKWKNLRDTYHQYRLRKQNGGNDFSKWRYAKELEFLSTIYQPKLKVHRQQNFDKSNILQSTEHALTTNSENQEIVLNGILMEYDENDGKSVHQLNDNHGMTHLKLNNGDYEVEIVKTDPLDDEDDDDCVTAAIEPDYEEVCLYEESATTSMDCGTIIGDRTSTVTESQYIDANDFCIDTMNIHNLRTTNNCSSNILANNITQTKTKVVNYKNIKTEMNQSSIMKPNNDIITTNTMIEDESTCSSSTKGQQLCETREELDLFFDFLKKKMQHFSKDKITSIQVEFLNSVLKYEEQKYRCK